MQAGMVLPSCAHIAACGHAALRFAPSHPPLCIPVSSCLPTQVNAMVRVDGADASALADCDPELLNVTVLASGEPAMPPQEKHANRGMTLGPDGMLYYTVGAPFDSGEECEEPYCSVWRMATDGSGLERVASGLRNAAAFTWNPSTGDLLVAAMERTGLGDERELCGALLAWQGLAAAAACCCCLLLCNTVKLLPSPAPGMGGCTAAGPDDLLLAINTSDPLDWRWPYCHWCAAAAAIAAAGPHILLAIAAQQAVCSTNLPLPCQACYAQPAPPPLSLPPWQGG